MDFRIIDSGNGGDLVFDGGDLVLTSEIYNQPYLARFAGNVENNSTDEFKDGDIRGDWWANELLLTGKLNEQLNSKFEKALNEIPLNIAGRKQLELIAKKDTEYLNGTASVVTSVILPGVDRVNLKDNVTQGNNTNFSYIWDNAKGEIL